MIDPKRPKPTGNRHQDSTEPRFEESRTSDDQPMYATEPDAPDAGREQGGDPYGRAPGPRWDVPGGNQPASAGGPGQAAQSGRPAQGQPAQQGPQEQAAQGMDDQAELKAALAAAEAKARESQEQYLRALAEMENVRRRAQEDVSKAHKFAIEGFAESLLPVRDSLEMALTVEVPSVESLREGVEATLRQLTQAFERNRLLVIDPLHQKFDPNRHQAISVAPSKDVAPNHVVSVLQKGYMINDRILRPALVTVSQQEG
jgi:molecular chaperone GrpE